MRSGDPAEVHRRLFCHRERAAGDSAQFPRPAGDGAGAEGPQRSGAVLPGIPHSPSHVLDLPGILGMLLRMEDQRLMGARPALHGRYSIT